MAPTSPKISLTANSPLPPINLLPKSSPQSNGYSRPPNFDTQRSMIWNIAYYCALNRWRARKLFLNGLISGTSKHPTTSKSWWFPGCRKVFYRSLKSSGRNLNSFLWSELFLVGSVKVVQPPSILCFRLASNLVDSLAFAASCRFKVPSRKFTGPTRVGTRYLARYRKSDKWQRPERSWRSLISTLESQSTVMTCKHCLALSL